MRQGCVLHTLVNPPTLPPASVSDPESINEKRCQLDASARWLFAKCQAYEFVIRLCFLNLLYVNFCLPKLDTLGQHPNPCVQPNQTKTMFDIFRAIFHALLWSSAVGGNFHLQHQKTDSTSLLLNEKFPVVLPSNTATSLGTQTCILSST